MKFYHAICTKDGMYENVIEVTSKDIQKAAQRFVDLGAGATEIGVYEVNVRGAKETIEVIKAVAQGAVTPHHKRMTLLLGAPSTTVDRRQTALPLDEPAEPEEKPSYAVDMGAVRPDQVQ